jgi:Protein of unknown function (DUF3575)
MKKILILLFITVLNLPLFSQESSEVSTEKNVIKVNTLSLVIATGSIFYERKISDLTSVQMGVAYMGYSISKAKFAGYVLTPEFRIYPKKNALDGFYVAPYLRYFNLSAKSTSSNDKASLTVMGGGILIGRQWITNSGFNMDLFVGGHYASGSASANSGDAEWVDSNLFTGFKTRVGFAIGFAF